VDTRRIEGHWQGYLAGVYGGAGRGEEQLITSSPTSGVLATTPWTAAPGAGSYYELHKAFGVAEYNRAIDRAVLRSGTGGLIPVVDEALTASASTYEYTVPAGLAWVAEVWTRDTTASTNDWLLLTRKNHDYDLLPARGILRLRSPSDNLRLRLVGQMRPELLRSDSSIVDAPPDYLVAQAAAYLAAQKLRGPQLDRDAWGVRYQLFAQEAQALRPDARPLTGGKRVF
jgi:hypothetical protein